MPLAQYSFLPWLRHGLSRQIIEADTLGQSEGSTLGRPIVPVTLHCDVVATDGTALPEQEIAKSIQIMSPGDIVGIQSAAIIRTEPPNGTSKFATNSLPYIEFYEEDFAWRYTPAQPVETTPGNKASTKLRPWIFLVTLEENEFDFNAASGNNGPAYISVKQASFDNAFPHHDQIWAWAHVHMSTKTNADNTEIATMLSQNPDNGLCRIVSPRKLKDDRTYHIFLIPSFESGRLAGLGIDIPETLGAQTPAWKTGAMPTPSLRPFDFPVYHHSTFTTGKAGDFESCVRSLIPTHDTTTFAGRTMSIAQSGYGFDTTENETVLVEGALKPVGFDSPPWPVAKPPVDKAAQTSYQKTLKTLLNAGAQLQNITSRQAPHPLGFSEYLGDDPLVTPPIYGSLHRNVATVGKSTASLWIDTLNLLPQNRAIAGLGAKDVRDNQDDLMEKAWMQIDTVTEANKRLQEALLASETLQRMHEKHIAVISGDQNVIMRTTSLLSSVKSNNAIASPVIAHDLAQSKVPQAVISASFKRMMRPSRNIIKRMNTLAKEQGQANPAYKNLFVNFNKSGDDHDPDPARAPLTAAKSKRPPVCALPTTALDNALVKAQQKLDTPAIAAQHSFLAIAAQVTLPPSATIVAVRNQFTTFVPATPLDQHDLLSELIAAIRTWNPAADVVEVIMQNNIYAFRFGKSTTGKYKQIGTKQVLVRRNLYASEKAHTFTEMTDASMLADYASKFSSLSTIVMSGLDAEESSQALPYSQTINAAKAIVDSLHPKVSFFKRFANTIIIDGATEIQSTVPIQAYPVIDEPSFPYIAKQSQDWIIPNIDKVPFNSVMVLESNQKFIEAYCAGFNYEFARELLWNEYPTDMRVSSMRTFWDVKDNQTSTYKSDVKELHLWDKDLGKNGSASDTYLVLLVRGDLLRKYPNTIVSMQAAKFSSNDVTKARLLDDSIAPLQPVFAGELKPDIAFFGFKTSPEIAKGKRIPGSSMPGYFFVFKERPGQIHFGLDDSGNNFNFSSVAQNADDLSWGHLVASQNELDSLSTINLENQIRITDDTNGKWTLSNSASIASSLFQNPVMFARHADTLI